MPLRQKEVNAAINSIGVGQYQLIVIVLGGGIYAAEGSLLLMIGLVAKGLVDAWDLSPLMAGAMATVVFLGLTVGTILGGMACDVYGRRNPILITYAGIVVFLLISLTSQGFLMLIIAKFLLGIFMGFGLPASNAIVCECCPVTHRSNIYSATMVLFALGQMYSAAVIWGISPTLDYDVLNWRMLIAIGTLPPAILFFAAYFCLIESAHWLVVNDREQEAKSAVMRMAKINGKPVADFDELIPLELPEASEDGVSQRSSYLSRPMRHSHASAPDTPRFSALDERSINSDDDRKKTASWDEWCALNCSWFWRVASLFSPYYRLTTIIMTYICFASNFAYYGMIYGLPLTLRTMARQSDNAGSFSPAAGIFLSALFEIPGVFLAIVLGLTLGRRANMALAFSFSCIFISLLIYALFEDKMDTIGWWCIFGVKMFIAAGFIVVYLYLLECYPTIFRATGLAFCMVVGRLGAFCCPFVHDGFHQAEFHYAWFFVAIAVNLFLAATASFLLPYETKDAPLADM